MDVLGLKWHKTGTVGRLKVHLPRTGDSLGTEALAQSPEIRRRMTALRKVGTEVDHRKYKDIGHSFGLGTSAARHVVDAIRS
jgi:hypothetical protein